jgi:hypothetical protein
MDLNILQAPQNNKCHKTTSHKSQEMKEFTQVNPFHLQVDKVCLPLEVREGMTFKLD